MHYLHTFGNFLKMFNWITFIQLPNYTFSTLFRYFVCIQKYSVTDLNGTKLFRCQTLCFVIRWLYVAHGRRNFSLSTLTFISFNLLTVNVLLTLCKNWLLMINDSFTQLRLWGNFFKPYRHFQLRYLPFFKIIITCDCSGRCIFLSYSYNKIATVLCRESIFPSKTIPPGSLKYLSHYSNTRCIGTNLHVPKLLIK